MHCLSLDPVSVNALLFVAPLCVCGLQRVRAFLFRSTCSANRWAHREKGLKAKGDNSWKGSIQQRHRLPPARLVIPPEFRIGREGRRHFVSSKSHNLRRRTTPFLLSIVPQWNHPFWCHPNVENELNHGSWSQLAI